MPPPPGGPPDASPTSNSGGVVLGIAAAIQRLAAAPATSTEAAPLALCYALDTLKLSCDPEAVAAAAAQVVPAAFAAMQLCPADALVAVAALDVLTGVYERKKSAAAGQVLERADALHFLEGVPALVAALVSYPAVAEEACLILADLAAVSPRAKERLTGAPGGIAALLRTAAGAGALLAHAQPSNLILEELAHKAERAAYNALVALGWAADVGPDVQRAIADAGGAAVIARTLRPRGRRQVERNQQAAALTLLLKLYPLCLAAPPVRLSLVDAGVATALRALADDPASPVPPATAVQGRALLAAGLLPADFDARVAQEAAARPAAATACAAALTETATDSQRKGLELLRKMCEGAKVSAGRGGGACECATSSRPLLHLQLSTLAAPVDPNTGATDACFVGSAIIPVTSVAGNSSYTVISGLPVNFPLVINVTASDASGLAVAQVIPHRCLKWHHACIKLPCVYASP